MPGSFLAAARSQKLPELRLCFFKQLLELRPGCTQQYDSPQSIYISTDVILLKHAQRSLSPACTCTIMQIQHRCLFAQTRERFNQPIQVWQRGST